MIEMGLKPGSGTQDFTPGFFEFDSPQFGVTGQFPPDIPQTPLKTDLVRHPPDLPVCQPEDLCHFSDSCPGGKGVVVGYHGRPAVAVPGKDIIDYLVPLVPCKVHINVRRVHSPGV